MFKNLVLQLCLCFLPPQSQPIKEQFQPLGWGAVVVEVHSLHYYHDLVLVFDSEEDEGYHLHPQEMVEASSVVQSESEEIVGKIDIKQDSNQPKTHYTYTYIPVHQEHSG